MYLPNHYEESRSDVLHGVIAQYPLGTLVTNGRSGMQANHVPFELLTPDTKPLGVLQAHVARANPVWQDVSHGDEVLVVFRAFDAYISPSWYPSKHQRHDQVPTWNYLAVHARGRIAIHDDERYVRGVVARLTRTHEASQPNPWRMRDLTKEAQDTMLTQIVGLEIEVTSLIGKFKLSQNKSAHDVQGASDALKSQGCHIVGDAMLKSLRR